MLVVLRGGGGLGARAGGVRGVSGGSGGRRSARDDPTDGF